MSPDTLCDALIIGGGVAGSAAALTLLHAGVRRVTILEPSDFSEPRVGETVPPDINHLLQKLFVLKRFQSLAPLPCYGSQSLWGSRITGHNDFLVSPYGNGWHLDRVRFDQMLLEAAKATGARVVQARCTRVVAAHNRLDAIESSDGCRFKASWYIDASGRSSIVGRALGIRRQVDDRQIVAWARFKTTKAALGNATWLESSPYGWWYAAQIPGGTAVVALGTDPVLAKSLGLLNIGGWAVALSGTQLIAPKLGAARLDRESYTLTTANSWCATKVAGENWLSIGDAAAALDPLSSAGIYKALANGIMAAEIVSQGQDLRMYSEAIHQDHQGYLMERSKLYDAERTWADQTFWKQRTSRPTSIQKSRL